MNNLMVLRKKHNKKAVDLAAALGVSRKHYYDLEKGNRRLNEKHIKIFMETYNCSADDILYHKYTREDFQDNPEELSLEIEKIIRFLTIKNPTISDEAQRFPGIIVHLIKEYSEDLRRAHDLYFQVTPFDMKQLAREIDDFDFRMELLEILERVKERRIYFEKEPDDGIPSPIKVKEDDIDYGLNLKEERDIALDLEKMLSDLESDNALAFQGEPMDAEDKELLRMSLENSLRLAKQMAKNKFNPNKNKK